MELQSQKFDYNMKNHNLSDAFIEHMKSACIILDRMIFKCKHCDAAFEREQKYKLHLLSHITQSNGGSDGRFVKRFKCEECGEAFVLESTLDEHAAVHEPFPHMCHCGIGFYAKQDLNGHKQLVHKVEINKELEKLSFWKKRALNNEIWVPAINYTGPKAKDELTNEFKKPIGPRLRAELVVKSKTKSKRKGRKPTNRKNPSGETDIVCDLCNKKFLQKQSLVLHLRSHAGLKEFSCDLCGKVFAQAGTLKLHMQRHAGLKEFPCALCTKKFNAKSNMLNHMRTHTGEKPYKCQFCEKAFSDQSAHKRHERTHTGVKPYACSYCGMAFSDASGRIVHERRHIGRKKHKCDNCTQKFYTSAELRNHTKTVHESEKNFECDKCSKCFALKSYLYIHMKSHANAKTKKYQCDYCGVKKISKDYLRIHIVNVHLKKLRR